MTANVLLPAQQTITSLNYVEDSNIIYSQLAADVVRWPMQLAQGLKAYVGLLSAGNFTTRALIKCKIFVDTDSRCRWYKRDFCLSTTHLNSLHAINT